MKYSTDLLYRFSRGIGRAELDPLDGVMEVPAVQLLTLQLPGPLVRGTGFVTTDNQRESFRVSQIRSHLASTAEDLRTTCTFGRGIWRIEMIYTFVASWTQAFDGSQALANSIEMVDPGNSVIELVHAHAVANVPAYLRWDSDLHFPEDDWRFQMRTGATGVGQTHTGLVTVVANRLA